MEVFRRKERNGRSVVQDAKTETSAHAAAATAATTTRTQSDATEQLKTFAKYIFQ